MSMGARINQDELDTFKRSWPCHGLPDKLWSIYFQFETNGDLVDIVARARNGRLLDSSEFDGPALVALADDAKAKLRPRDTLTPSRAVAYRTGWEV